MRGFCKSHSLWSLAFMQFFNVYLYMEVISLYVYWDRHFLANTQQKGAMVMAGEFLSWSELVDRPVYVAGQGRQAGLVDDFYYDPETQSIPALHIKTRLNGPRVLLA